MAYDPTAPLPQTQEGLWRAILGAFTAINAQATNRDMATGRLRMIVFGPNSGVAGVGGSNPGVIRVVPASDSFMGNDTIASQAAVDMNAASLAEIYDNIRVS